MHFLVNIYGAVLKLLVSFGPHHDSFKLHGSLAASSWQSDLKETLNASEKYSIRTESSA